LSHSDPGRLPIIDARVLKRLRAELGTDAEYSTTFVGNYLQQLPLRTSRLRIALAHADRVAALETVLSLKTSSWMVGAVCLGTLSRELESFLNALPEDELPLKMPELCGQNLIMDRIERCGRLTAQLLGAPEAA
jgi:HPt (histidine-containing phosphotransfer) domain-containing protein